MTLRVVALAILLAGCSGDALVSRTLGARCDTSEECNDRCLATPEASFPGGFCSLSCEATRECPTDASCADLVGGVCLFDCFDDTECAFLGRGWRCFTITSREDVMQTVKVCLGA